MHGCVNCEGVQSRFWGAGGDKIWMSKSSESQYKAGHFTILQERLNVVKRKETDKHKINVF